MRISNYKDALPSLFKPRPSKGEHLQMGTFNRLLASLHSYWVYGFLRFALLDPVEALLQAIRIVLVLPSIQVVF